MDYLNIFLRLDFYVDLRCIAIIWIGKFYWKKVVQGQQQWKVVALHTLWRAQFLNIKSQEANILWKN